MISLEKPSLHDIAKSGTVKSTHGNESADLYFQVVAAAAAFTPAGEMERRVEKGVKGFFKEELVENLNGSEVTVVLEVVVVPVMVEEVVEGTPGEAVGVMKMIPVEEGEVHIMLEKIRKLIAVTIQVVMAL